MASSPREFYQLCPVSAPDVDEVWVDYVADTGDGFDSTFATARCMSGGTSITCEGEELDRRPERADLVVLGGDEVYPAASASEYETRFTGVLRRAAVLDRVEERPPILALPGNHDWYDGLAAFRRIFCSSRLWRPEEQDGVSSAGDVLTPISGMECRDDIGGWGAFQSRSYFAIKLTARWWLWAVDSQLDTPLDVEQMSYFRSAAEIVKTDADARIILCTATPSWLEAQQRRSTYVADADTPFFTLLWFIDRTLGQDHRHRIRLMLTGDEHHYARYAPTQIDVQSVIVEKDGKTTVDQDALFAPELVTCGGGGAYLASTHHLGRYLTFDPKPWTRTPVPGGTGPGDDERLRYERQRTYPTRGRSLGLSFTGLLPALWRNGISLPLLLGAANLPLFASILLHPQNGWLSAWQFWVSLGAMAALLFAYALSGTKKADRSALVRKSAAGLLATLHTCGQLAISRWMASLLSPWWETRAADRVPWTAPWPPALSTDLGRSSMGVVAFWAAAILGLGVLGMIVFVLYLRIADLIRCHTVEAFSALQIKGYKCHLRLKVTPQGVTAWVVAMDAVPKGWWWTKLTDISRPRAYVLERFDVAADPSPSLKEVSAATKPVLSRSLVNMQSADPHLGVERRDDGVGD